jgi:peptidoglycan/LPS O-acetylase OafA/YrhL
LSGLDGLRAFAVIGVLLYHGGVRWLPGGFLGVDLFFVISGFLITWLLVAERQRDGAISIRRFYARRARRLLPALAAMVASTTAFMAVFFRGDLDQARGDIAAAAGYFSNWWYVLHHRSYFVAAGRQPPFQHLWSLAVEEQFYLVWPLLLVVLLVARVRLRWVFAVATAGAVASAWWMRTLAIRGDVPYDTDSSRLYFGTDTHASSLLIGAAAAALMLGLAARRQRRHREVSSIATLLADLAGIAAIGGVIWAMHSWSEVTPSLFRGGFFVFALVAVVLVATVSLPGSWLGAVLDVQPMRWIGTRSYGLYLWHWPIFVYTRPGLDWQLHGLTDLTVRLAITAVLTELTFQLVERPIRERGFAGLARHWPALPKRHDGLGRVPRPARAFAPVLGGVCGVLLIVGGTTFVANHHGSRASNGASSRVVHPSSSAPPQPTAPGTVLASPSRSVLPSPTAPGSASSGSRSKPSVTPPPPQVKPSNAAAPPAGTSEKTPPKIPDGPPPLLTGVGDSVMLDGQVALEESCDSEVYAVVGWQAKSVFAEIATLRAANHLGQVVVIGTGTNGLVKEQELDAVLTSLADRTKVIVVNDHMNRPWEPPNNAMFPKVVAKHPNAVLVDWDTAANTNPKWIGSDGVHLAAAGRVAYANLIKKAAGC